MGRTRGEFRRMARRPFGTGGNMFPALRALFRPRRPRWDWMQVEVTTRVSTSTPSGKLFMLTRTLAGV